MLKVSQNTFFNVLVQSDFLLTKQKAWQKNREKSTLHSENVSLFRSCMVPIVALLFSYYLTYHSCWWNSQNFNVEEKNKSIWWAISIVSKDQPKDGIKIMHVLKTDTMTNFLNKESTKLKTKRKRKTQS